MPDLLVASSSTVILCAGVAAQGSCVAPGTVGAKIPRAGFGEWLLDPLS